MEQLFKDIEASYGKEKANLCRDVVSVVRAKVISRDLFGWRTFIQEMLEDLVLYMINDKFAHTGGGYVACGMQSAIDHCRYCSAAKRRGDYELVSLDDFFQVQDIEEDSGRGETDKLILDITIRFGKELADEIEPFARGYEDKLSAKVLKIIRGPEFVEWFKEYTGRK